MMNEDLPGVPEPSSPVGALSAAAAADTLGAAGSVGTAGTVGSVGSVGSAGIGQATEYRGNTSDVIAFTAAVSGITMCGYLATNGLACCLPIALGIAGLAMAKDAGDPKRARTLSLIGIASVGMLLLFFLACIVLYFGFVALMAISSSGSSTMMYR